MVMNTTKNDKEYVKLKKNLSKIIVDRDELIRPHLEKIKSLEQDIDDLTDSFIMGLMTRRNSNGS